MPWQNIFYIMGTVVFVTWFLLLATAIMTLILMVRRTTALKAMIEERLNNFQEQMGRRFHRPTLGVMMTVLPLIPIFITLMRKFRHRG